LQTGPELHAGGNLGMDRVAKGTSGGSQICIVPPGIATNPYLYPRVPFDPEKDFVLLGHVASVPNLLCVRKDLSVNSVADLVAHAKANPGKPNYAPSGIGTTGHPSAELFKRMAGVDMVHVAYRGSRQPSTMWWAKTST
jgi:tripartite-type tricarboxylate transporter receptor subunit TctC